MNNHENASLYKIEDIKTKCDSKKINLVSSEVTLYSNYLIIKSKNETKNLKIFYQDITFHAIEKQKKMIIICDIKKYNIINFFCNSEDEMNEFFNQINTCINENNNINEDNIEKLIMINCWKNGKKRWYLIIMKMMKKIMKTFN